MVSKNALSPHIIFKIYCFQSTILIPSLYICNTEEVKDYLKTIDWYNNLLDKLRSNKVYPARDEEINLHRISNNSSDERSNKREVIFTAEPNSNRLSRSNSEPQVIYKLKEKQRKKSI